MSNTIKLIVMITSDDIERIDDWRFSQRVASRSEAVRRLLAMGLDTPMRVGNRPLAPGDDFKRGGRTSTHPGRLIIPSPDAPEMLSDEAAAAARKSEVRELQEGQARAAWQDGPVSRKRAAKGLQAGGVEE